RIELVRAAGDRDGLEAGVGADRAQDVAHVVAYGVEAQMQLGGDLACRAASLEQLEHPGPARRPREGRMGVRRLDAIRDLTEHTDDVLPASPRTGADLDSDPLAVRVDDREAAVGDVRGPDDLARELLPGASRVLRRDNRRELTADHVADDLPRRGVDPADDP